MGINRLYEFLVKFLVELKGYIDMSHGGAREGAGRKAKYTDDQGNPLKSRPMIVPEIIQPADIQRLAREKLSKDKQS
jgi:hypothetical protein